jgi:AraC family transcriptional regulator
MSSKPSPIILSGHDKRVELSGFVLTQTYRHPGFVLPPHFHEYANIALALDGSFIETVGAKPYEVHPCSVIFRPAGERHVNRYGKTAAKCLIIEVRPQRLAEVRQVTEILDRASYVEPGLLSHLVLAISREFRMLDELAPLAIESLILEMLVEATRLSSSGERNPPQWLRQAREVLHEQFAESLSLPSVAGLVGVHTAHLAKMFRKHYGCTVGGYVRMLRLDYSAKLLAQFDKSLSAIAFVAGFYDQSHFTHLFKLRFGITPGDFRADLRRKQVSIAVKKQGAPPD